MPLTVQPLSVTLTESDIGPALPAVNEMVFVPLPELMVPLTMLQAYVAPACSGTLAERPLSFSSTDVGPLIVALGDDVRVTVCVAVDAQPAELVTVTVYVCDAAVCVAVIDGPVPPFDQRYELKPAPAVSV